MQKYNNIITELPGEEDYEFLGANSAGGEILQPDGQWDSCLPIFELQRNNFFDSYSCVAFARCNVLEALHKRKYGTEPNYSDRFTSVMTGTVPGKGNSLIGGAREARRTGNVFEDDYPSITPSMSEAEFYKPITQELKNKGLKWLEDYEIKYDWVDKLSFSAINREKAMEALKYSPLQTAIDAGTKDPNKFRGYNDSVVIVGFEEGKCWKVFGSYPFTTGEYPWNYPFYNPLRFNLIRKRLILTSKNMQLIKIKDDSAVYYIDHSTGFSPKKRVHPFITEEDYQIFVSEEKDWSLVQEVSKEEFDENFVVGETLTLQHKEKASLLENIKSLLGL